MHNLYPTLIPISSFPSFVFPWCYSLTPHSKLDRNGITFIPSSSMRPQSITPISQSHQPLQRYRCVMNSPLVVTASPPQIVQNFSPYQFISMIEPPLLPLGHLTPFAIYEVSYFFGDDEEGEEAPLTLIPTRFPSPSRPR